MTSVVAERFPDRRHALEIARRGVADAELHRAVAGRDERPGLVHELGGLLIAERHPARVRRDRSRGAAEQPVERPARRLPANIPERLIDAAHGQGRGGPHAVAAELHLVHARPHADDIGRVHPEHELAQRRVTRWATAPGARPWWDSPQPTTPSSVVTLTITASRFTARPMPSVTLPSGGRGNDVGYALSSTIFIASSECGPRGVYVNSEGLASQCQGVSCVLTFPSCHGPRKPDLPSLGKDYTAVRSLPGVPTPLHHPEFTDAVVLSPRDPSTDQAV